MYVGVDVRDTKIAIGLVNDNGRVSFQSSLAIDPDKNSEGVILDIVYIIKSISEAVPLELFNDRLLGIGIGILDTLDKNSGNIIPCADSRLGSISQEEMIQRHFEIPIFVENHAAAKALASNELGDLKGPEAGIVTAAMLCKYMK